ncbi:energy-coupling factor transporter ATPase [Bacillaceae bacterium Marseille-Q3522]|nr:energy-coupling factor transporter ATPase [Bacillaceae bacterium Marseille-Q3522]
MDFIEFHDVFYQYDKRNTLNTLSDIHLTIKKGEWVAIVGENGSGKSTLAKMLVALNLPDKGEIIIDGIPVTERTKWLIRRRVGIVFQNPDNQFVAESVQDDVAFTLENQNIPLPDMQVRVRQALEDVGMLEFAKQDPSHLSGGQKQRVALAGVLVMRPEVMVLDEATVMLDPTGREELNHIIRSLHQKQKMTIVTITHDMEEALQADRFIVMQNGKIIQLGKPEQLLGPGCDYATLGLTPPFTEQLKQELAKRGEQIPDQFMTDEMLVDFIWKSYFNT